MNGHIHKEYRTTMNSMHIIWKKRIQFGRGESPSMVMSPESLTNRILVYFINKKPSEGPQKNKNCN